MRAINIVIMFVAIAFALQFAFGEELVHSPITILSQLIDDPWSSQDAWQVLITGIWSASVVGIFAGTILNRSLYIYASFAASMATWIGAIVDVSVKAKNYGLFGGNDFIINFITIVFILVYMFMLIEFVRGRDT